MSSLIIARQTSTNPIAAPVISTPAAAASLEVATSCNISGTCDTNVTSVAVLLATGELLGTTTQTAGAYSFKWSPGRERAGAQTLVVRAYRGTSYAQTTVAVTVPATPLAALWDLGYWDASTLEAMYSDGALVTNWPAMTGATAWTASDSFAPTWAATGWGQGANAPTRGCVRFNGSSQYMLANALVAAFTGTNARTVFMVYRTISGVGTQTLICASASSGSSNKWQIFATGTPAAYKVIRGATTTTFGTAADQRNDLGQHFLYVRDPGTAASAITLTRDKLWQGTNAQSGANAAVTANTSTILALAANFNGTASPTNFGNFDLLAVGLSTQALTSAQLEKCAWQALGKFDKDQYYGDSAAPFKLDFYGGQSNTQGLAVSVLSALSLIRFLAISTNNWLADMQVLVSTGPQGVGPYIGPWYQCSQNRKVATGVDVHNCLMGQGATGVNTFATPANDGLYSTTLFDQQARVIQEAKCALGGTPTIDRVFIVEGETDSQSAPGSSTYQANLTTWCTNLRTLIPGISAATRIVAPQVSTFSAYAFGAAVQAAQVAWAAADVNAAAPSVSSLASAGFFNVDAIHYNQAGQLGLGAIMAAA